MQVRRQNADDHFQWGYDACRGDWWLFFDGSYRELGERTEDHQPLNIRVEDDKIFGPGTLEVDNIDYESGGILIYLAGGEIDNLVITRND